MVASTEVLDTLKSIGLNLYERKIFVALLAKGVATAAEVSEIASVPRSRSYDVLQSLAEKGFVMVQPSKPIKYVALEPAEALERTKQIMKKNHDEMTSRIDKLKDSAVLTELNGLYRKGLNLVQPSEMTGTLKGRHIINRQLRSIFKGAKANISILTTEKGVNDLYSNHFRVLKKITKGGVKLRIAAPLADNSAVNAFAAIAEMRNIRQPIGRFCLIDNDHLLFSLTDDKSTHETQDVAFWASSKHAVRDVIQPYFNRIWSAGADLKR
ncbi:MAG: TrmB family transcriptional regulator [Candidatus Aenigmatarchaeota archaeon]